MSEQTPHAVDERRQYYRNKNSVFVKFEQIDAEDPLEPDTPEQDHRLESTHLLKSLGELIKENTSFSQSLESESQSTMNHLDYVNRQLIKLVDYVNTKFDLNFSELLEVDLSGGGIRFESDTEMELKQRLKLQIVLVPDYYNVSVKGSVVDCQPNSDRSRFYIAVNFEQISEFDRDAIIKHVFKSQSEQLRSLKQSDE